MVEDDSLSLLLDDSEIPADMRFMIERDAAAIMTISASCSAASCLSGHGLLLPADGDGARYETLFGTLPLFANPPMRRDAAGPAHMPAAHLIAAAFCEMQCRIWWLTAGAQAVRPGPRPAAA